jgi:hypothetical protein
VTEVMEKRPRFTEVSELPGSTPGVLPEQVLLQALVSTSVETCKKYHTRKAAGKNLGVRALADYHLSLAALKEFDENFLKLAGFCNLRRVLRGIKKMLADAEKSITKVRFTRP